MHFTFKLVTQLRSPNHTCWLQNTNAAKAAMQCGSLYLTCWSPNEDRELLAMILKLLHAQTASQPDSFSL